MIFTGMWRSPEGGIARQPVRPVVAEVVPMSDLVGIGLIAAVKHGAKGWCRCASRRPVHMALRSETSRCMSPLSSLSQQT